MAIWPAHPAHPNVPASSAGWLTGGTWVIIQALTRPDLTVGVLLDEDGQRITRAGGIWSQHTRPGDVGIVEYEGRELLQQELGIIYDGWPNWPGLPPRGMDHYIFLVEEIADRGLPIRLIGPVSKAERKWVIESVAFGETLRDVATGVRLRQRITLHLLEYVVGAELQKLPRSTATPRSFRWYVVEHGDDLQRIATKALGRSSRWPEIAQINDGIRAVKLDPRRFPPGTRIKVPKE